MTADRTLTGMSDIFIEKTENIRKDADCKRTGLYIHIPFCVKKCSYCAFLSFPADESLRSEYTDALISEIIMRSKEHKGTIIDTVYIGGGTPSVLDVSQLSRIIKAAAENFEIAPDAEITLEVNPGTLGSKERVTRAKLNAYRAMGINRLSMGVQSMDNDRLHFMGRIHTPGDVVRDFRIAREIGFDNINLDLIFSVPGETPGDAINDAQRIIELRPEHISCYSLQMEEGTPFFEMAERGEITEVADEEDRETYHRICRILGSAGYEHYEISNFARETYRSKHNSLYWNMDDYIGCGLGASGFAGGVRYRNTADPEKYLKFFGSEKSIEVKCADAPYDEVHVNTPFDNISEAVFTGLRRMEGITYTEAARAYRRGTEDAGIDDKSLFWEVFADARQEAEQYCEQGFLVIDDRGLRLTETGIDISNSIMALFV